MLNIKLLSALSLTLMISGCIETKEEIKARFEQFNGKKLPQVIAVIGKPIAQDRTKAIWQYHSSYTRSIPIQQYHNGKPVTVGYRKERVNINCTYTAHLRSGRVETSSYEGNRCDRYAPRPKKKK